MRFNSAKPTWRQEMREEILSLMPSLMLIGSPCQAVKH